MEQAFPYQTIVVYDCIHAGQAAFRCSPNAGRLFQNLFYLRNMEHILSELDKHKDESWFKTFFGKKTLASLFPAFSMGATEGRISSGVVEGAHASLSRVRAQNNAYRLLVTTFEVCEKRLLERKRDMLQNKMVKLTACALILARHEFDQNYVAFMQLDDVANVTLESRARQVSSYRCHDLHRFCLHHCHTLRPFLTCCTHETGTGHVNMSNFKSSIISTATLEHSNISTEHSVAEKWSSHSTACPKGKGLVPCKRLTLGDACFDSSSNEFHDLIYVMSLTPKIAKAMSCPTRRSKMQASTAVVTDHRDFTGLVKVSPPPRAIDTHRR